MRVILRGFIASWLDELYLRYWYYKMPLHEEVTMRYRRMRLYQGE
jgi:hypothetical protein